MLTVAFAVYALGFLAAALVLGSLSDHLGRRPVLIGALVVQLASNLVFLFAPDVGWVIAGRIVQGIASGAATAAFTAALVEHAPAGRKGWDALGSVGLTGGLALGSLLAGLPAIQLRQAGTRASRAARIVGSVAAGGAAPTMAEGAPATLARGSLPATVRRLWRGRGWRRRGSTGARRSSPAHWSDAWRSSTARSRSARVGLGEAAPVA